MKSFKEPIWKKGAVKLLLSITIVLALILIGIFVYRYFFIEKTNSFLLENNYYGFELKTPINWIAKWNGAYSQEAISSAMDQCHNDKSVEASGYEVGAFQFKDKEFPEDAVQSPTINSATYPTGAILEVKVKCVPGYEKGGVADNIYTGLRVGGEKTFAYFLSLAQFGKAKYISFMHNGLMYEIGEYVYIAPKDKSKNEDGIKKSYEDIFKKIVSSFKFTK